MVGCKMTNFIRRQSLPAAIGVLLFFTAISSWTTIERWWLRRMPAIEWVSAEAVTKTVKIGGVLSIIYKSYVNKQCPSDLRGFLVAPDGSSPIRFPTLTGGYSSPSRDLREIKVSILIPTMSDPGLAPLTSGEYSYRTTAVRYCPEGVEYDSLIPEVKFQLEVP